MADRTVRIILTAVTAPLEAGFAKSAAAARTLEREIETGSRKNAQGLQNLGRASALVGAGLLTGVAVAVTSFARFQKSMSGVQAVSNATASQLDQLSKAAINAGKATIFSASESANAEAELAKAGVSVNDILGGALRGSLNLAAAGQIGVAEAAQTAATAMVQFKLSGQDVPHIADLLASAANKAQGGVSDMGVALKYVGPVAHSMGVSLDETVGTIAELANSGILADQAGTSLRGTLTALTSPSKIAATEMKTLGINVYDASGQFVGFRGVAGQLHDKMKDLTNAERDQALGRIFGNNQITAARILYEGGAKSVDKWTTAVNDSGAAQRIASTQLDNISGDFEQLRGSLETAFIESGSAANGFARTSLQAITKVVNAYASLPRPIQGAVTAGAALVGSFLLVGGGALILIPKIAATKVALAELGWTSARTATALRLMNRAFLVTAIAEAGIQLGHWLGEASVANVSSHDLAGAFEHVGKGAQIGADGLALFRRHLGPFHNDVNTSADAINRFAEDAQAALGSGINEKLNRFFDVGGQNVSAFNKEVRELDPAFAQMVQSGNAKQAAFWLNQFLDAAGKKGVNVDELRAKFSLYNAALDGTGPAGEKATGAVKAFNAEAKRSEAVSAAAAKALQQWRDDLAGLVGGFITPLEAYTGLLEKKKAKEQASAQATADSTKSSKDSWKDYVGSVHVSINQYIGELEKQVKAQQNWESNLLKLSGRVSAGTLQQLEKMGKDGAPLVAELVNASDKQLHHLERLFRDTTKHATGAVADELIKAGPVLQAVAAQDGKKTADSYAEKLAHGTITVEQIAKRYGVALDHYIPPAKDTKVELKAISLAQRQADALKTKLDLIQGSYDAHINVTTTFTTIGSGAYAGKHLPVPGSATGGFIAGPGGPTSDSIPAMLSNGEYVVRASAVDHFGVGFFDRINRYAAGGRVGYATGGVASGTISGLEASIKGIRHQLQGDITKAERERLNKALDAERTQLDKLRGVEKAWRQKLRDTLSSASVSSLTGGIIATNSVTSQIRASFREIERLGGRLADHARRAEPHMLNLAHRAQEIDQRLQQAVAHLQNLRQARNALATGVTQGERSQTDITSFVGEGRAATPNAVKQFLRSKLTHIRQLNQAMRKLNHRGLSHSILRDIATFAENDLEGALSIAQGLLGADASELADINRLQGKVNRASKHGGNEFAGQLYDAGINAAEGLVSGLKARRHSIYEAMRDLAHTMRDAIRHALGIASPSKVMADDVGVHIPDGIVLGIHRRKAHVADAMAGLVAAANSTDQLRSAIAAGQIPAAAFLPAQASPTAAAQTIEHHHHVYHVAATEPRAVAAEVINANRRERFVRTARF